MGFKDIFDRLAERRPERPIALPVPPLAVGHYVSYVLQRQDRSWWACHMGVAQVMEDGGWLVVVQGRRPEVDTICIMSLAGPGEDGPVAMPLRLGLTRGSDEAAPGAVTSDATLAMNLLTPARFEGAAEALAADPEPAHYACDIQEVYPLHDPWPEMGYDKQHDLCPRVPITGVACTRIVGEDNRMEVTSFGSANPQSPLGPYEDYIDLSWLKPLTQHGFTSLWPVTWFLNAVPRQDPEDPRPPRLHVQLGGLSAACHVVIDRRAHTSSAERARWRHQVRRHDAASSTFEGPFDLQLGVDGEASRCSYRDGRVVGVNVDAWLQAPDGGAAEVGFFCCAFEDNPGRDATLEQAQAVWRAILESWRWDAP